MLLQALFGAATVLVTMLLARQVSGVQAAKTAGLICTLCPPALFLPTLFWETSLSILLATSLVAIAIRCADVPTLRWWLVMGIVSAAALAVNPSLLPIVICGFGWAMYRSRTQSLSAAATGVLLCVALSAPWAVRNYNQLHAFIPLRSNVGYELWQGNRVGSDGFFLATLHPNVNVVEFQRYESLGEVAYMREKLQLAKARINENRGWFISLTAKRAFYFWTGIALQSSGLVIAYISLTTVLGWIGLVRLRRSDSSLAAYLFLTLMLFPIPYYITHPDYRFRLVIDPVLVVLTTSLLTSRKTLEETGRSA
jgi:hypothetical protein